jgi:hypothetical protein
MRNVFFLLNASFDKAIGTPISVHEQFAEKFPETPLPHLQKVLANKIKQFHTCIDARKHHLQHLL